MDNLPAAYLFFDVHDRLVSHDGQKMTDYEMVRLMSSLFTRIGECVALTIWRSIGLTERTVNQLDLSGENICGQHNIYKLKNTKRENALTKIKHTTIKRTKESLCNMGNKISD